MYLHTFREVTKCFILPVNKWTLILRGKKNNQTKNHIYIYILFILCCLIVLIKKTIDLACFHCSFYFKTRQLFQPFIVQSEYLVKIEFSWEGYSKWNHSKPATKGSKYLFLKKTKNQNNNKDTTNQPFQGIPEQEYLISCLLCKIGVLWKNVCRMTLHL